MNLFIQQPSELPQPRDARPDQRFGEFTLQHFVEDNLWYILITAFIVLVVFYYSWDLRKRRRKAQEELEGERGNKKD